jgi:hypothetical protein
VTAAAASPQQAAAKAIVSVFWQTIRPEQSSSSSRREVRCVVITLLSDRLAPVTSSIGLLRMPLPDAAEALAGWRRELHGSASVEKVTGDLATLIGHLEPLTLRVRPRELLVATANDAWTAYFDCGLHGGDPVSVIGHLTRTLRVQGVVVRSVPHTHGTTLETPGRHGGVQFELFGPLATGFLNYVRTVSVIHDGSRWRFDANGTVQDFEDTERYTARRIRDRFTSEQLVRYCAALDLRPFDEDFYRPDGVLVESPVTPPPGAAVLPLAEAQRQLGIRPGVSADVPG